ncbi:hypothetical protein VTK26DRAFT_3133 [Humicola hyalothermophila]
MSSCTGSGTPAAAASAAAASPAPAPSTPPLPGNAPSQGPRPTVEDAPEQQQQQQQQGAAPASSSSSSTTTTTTTAAPDSQSDHTQSASQPPAASSSLPALPSPESATASSGADGGVRTVSVNGQAVALDNLGPMVVGRDGTVSRIANWGEMTEIERSNTLRILVKRNQLRLANLRAGRPADEKRTPGPGEEEKDEEGKSAAA